MAQSNGLANDPSSNCDLDRMTIILNGFISSDFVTILIATNFLKKWRNGCVTENNPLEGVLEIRSDGRVIILRPLNECSDLAMH